MLKAIERLALHRGVWHPSVGVWRRKKMLRNDHYTYRVSWSEEDGEYLGLCAEFPSLSWLATEPEAALQGIRQLVAGVVVDLRSKGEAIPEPLSDEK